MRNDSNRKWVFMAALVFVVAGIVASGCKKEADKPEKKAEPMAAQTGQEMPPGFSPLIGGGGKMVVQVGEKTLTQGELNQQLQKAALSRGLNRMPPAQALQAQAKLKVNLINGFIAQSVLLAEAEGEKVSITPDEVEKVIDSIKSRAPAGVTFAQALQNFGTTEVQLRRDIENDLKIKKFVDEYIEKIEKPSEKEVKAFYEAQASQFEQPETVQARHILIKCEADAPKAEKEEKMAKIEKIRKELKGGADFAELAKEHSACPSKSKGGDLGSFPRGGMVPPFEKAAFSQKIDEIGPIVTTKFGYHIVKVTQRNKAGKKLLSELTKQIEEQLMRKKKQDVVMEKITDLRAKADIKYAEGVEASLPNRVTPIE